MNNYEETVAMTARRHLLNHAADLVDGDRNKQYGDPSHDFRKTCDLWNTYIAALDRSLLPHDIAVMQILLKISRLSWDHTKEDTWTDIAGYAACGWDTAERYEAQKSTTIRAW